MEPLESEIVVNAYDVNGNCIPMKIKRESLIAKEATGPITTYTYDPSSGTVSILEPDRPDPI